MEGQFMKAYSIKEVQEITKVPSGTIRQWEFKEKYTTLTVKLVV